MLTQENIFEIRLLSSKRYSQRSISQELCFSRKTVRKYLIPTENQVSRPERKFEILGSFANTIDELIIDFPAIPAAMVYREIKSQGYHGSIYTVQEYIMNNVGKILGANKKILGFKIIKADLYQCMVKGNSYLKHIKKKSNFKNHSKNRGLTQKERLSIIKSGKSGKFKQWRFGVDDRLVLNFVVYKVPEKKSVCPC